MRPIPANRIGYAHGLLRALDKRGKLRLDEFVTEFSDAELYPPEAETDTGRTRSYISFLKSATFVKEERGSVELTDLGKRYIKSGNPNQPFAVSPGQAEWLRRQLREKHLTESIWNGAAIGLSLYATLGEGEYVALIDFGRASAHLGRAGWDSDNTFQLQGERFTHFLEDMELIGPDRRLTPTGEQTKDELRLPVHMSLKDLAAQLNPGGAEAAEAAAAAELEQLQAALAPEPEPEPEDEYVDAGEEEEPAAPAPAPEPVAVAAEAAPAEAAAAAPGPIEAAAQAAMGPIEAAAMAAAGGPESESAGPQDPTMSYDAAGTPPPPPPPSGPPPVAEESVPPPAAAPVQQAAEAPLAPPAEPAASAPPPPPPAASPPPPPPPPAPAASAPPPAPQPPAEPEFETSEPGAETMPLKPATQGGFGALKPTQAITALKPEDIAAWQKEQSQEAAAPVSAGAAPDGPFLDLEAVKKAAERRGLKLDDGVYAAAIAALASGRHLVLTGGAGSGKTGLALALAEAAVRQGRCGSITFTSAGLDMDGSETLGRFGDSGFKPGLVPEAIAKGQWLVIDELERPSLDDALGRVSTVLGGQPIDLPGGGELKPPKDWRVIATMGDLSRVGETSGALRRRFVFIEVPVLERAQLNELVDQWADGDDTAAAVGRRLVAINDVVELGPGLYQDAIAYVKARRKLAPADESSLTLEALAGFVLPQLEGLGDEVAGAAVRAAGFD
jgi:MoxR-like ATPase